MFKPITPFRTVPRPPQDLPGPLQAGKISGTLRALSNASLGSEPRKRWDYDRTQRETQRRSTKGKHVLVTSVSRNSGKTLRYVE